MEEYMQNYQSEYEKQMIAEKFAKQLKIMTICRIVMPLTMLALMGGIMEARGVWVDILFCAVIATAIALLVILLLGFRLNFCPFCGKRLSYSAREFGVLPEICRHCGEKLKY